MMAQPDRAQAEQFHSALVAAALDVLADPEGVVEHVEDAREDVLDQGLRAEADGDAEDAGAGDQRHDLHAETRQDGQHRDHRDEHGERVAEDRQQRAQPPVAGEFVGAAAVAGELQPVFDVGLGQLPHEIGDEQHDDAVEDALDDPLDGIAVADHRRGLAEDVGEPGDRQADHDSAGAAHDEHIGDQVAEAARMLAPAEPGGDAADAAHRRRQDEGIDAEPEHAIKAGHPSHPQKHQEHAGQPGPGVSEHAGLTGRGAPPDDLDGDRQEPEAERIADQPARADREAEAGHQADHRPAEQEKTGKQLDPHEPEPRDGIVDLDQPRRLARRRRPA